MITQRKQKHLGRLSLLVSALLLSACASSQQHMVNAAIRGDNAELEELLRDGKAYINLADEVQGDAKELCPGHETLTALQGAACSGKIDTVKKLIDKKADINKMTASGETALSLAVGKGHDDVVRLLVSSGADPDTRDKNGNTLLMRAADRGDTQLVEFLLKKNASVSLPGSDGVTALLVSESPGIAKLLLDAGARLTTTRNGESAVHYAAMYKSAEMVKFFIEAGVPADLRRADGKTALDLARERLGAENGVAGTESGVTRRELRLGAGAIRGQMMARRAAGSPAGTQERVGTSVCEVLEAEMNRLIEADAKDAERAAAVGNFKDAMAKYSATIKKAEGVNDQLERKLRVDLVKYVSTQETPPMLSESSREHLVRSSYMLKRGQDQAMVEKELLAVIDTDPWWTDGYYNLGVLQTERKEYDKASKTLKTFIACAPADPKAQAAQDKIYEINLAKEEVARVVGMSGNWIGNGQSFRAIIGDNSVNITSGWLSFNLKLANGALSGTVSGPSSPGAHGCTIPAQSHQVTGRLDANARTIDLDYIWANYETKFHCVNMAGAPSNCCLFCTEVCDGTVITETPTISLHLTPAP